MTIPEHWKIVLDGYPGHEDGDVITRDGEIIGAWSLVDGVFFTFTPNGGEAHIFFEQFLGVLCWRIDEWHEGREAVHRTPL